MNYSMLFSEAKLPMIDELKGNFNVRVLSSFLPEIQFLKHRKIIPDNIDINGGGYNDFLSIFKLGNFRIETGKSLIDDDLEVAKIIYNLPGNPFWLKRLTDELRSIDPGYLIGRAVYNVLDRNIPVVYFSLRRE